MPPLLSGAELPYRIIRDWLLRNWLLVGLLLLAFILTQLFLRAASFYWTRRDFIRLMHDSLGFGLAWSEFLSVPVAMLNVSLQTASLGWLLIGRIRPLSVAAVIVVFGTTPMLHAVFDTNFNQTTGEAQKYYVRRASGEFVLSDTGGVDPETGVERNPLTPRIAQIIEREKKGIRPHRVLGDVKTLAYFSATSGNPLIWFSVGPDKAYYLFDAEGFSPYDGTLLHPINQQIVDQIKAEANLLELETRAARPAKCGGSRAGADREDAPRVAGAVRCQRSFLILYLTRRQTTELKRPAIGGTCPGLAGPIR